MPGTDLTITGEQRDALYELVTNHVGDLDSVWLAMQKGDYAAAERKALEFMGDFRLLADLGWHPEDSRETVGLTMPREELADVLARIRSEADGGLSGFIAREREQREEEEKVEAAFRLARETCEGLIGKLASGSEADE
jgi:hypothetical protein